MRLKSILLCAYILIIGLFAVPSQAQLSYTIGTFQTAKFSGRVYMTIQDGVYTGRYCDFAGSNFQMFMAVGISMVNTPPDLFGTRHSIMNSYSYFTNEIYYNEPAVTTVTVTDPGGTGPTTISLRIVDYFNPAHVLYTSNGEIPLTHGSITISP